MGELKSKLAGPRNSSKNSSVSRTKDSRTFGETLEARDMQPNEMKKSRWRDDGKVFFSIFILSQAFIFVYSFISLNSDASLSDVRNVVGYHLAIARSSGNVINLLGGIILFTVCKNLISKMRVSLLNRLIPLDKNIEFHIYVAQCIFFWSIVHVVSHYFNYLYVSQSFKAPYEISPEELSYASGTGWTGNLLGVILILIGTSAAEAVRRKHFEIFWVTHHLFIVFFGLALIHGSYCFIKSNATSKVDPCRGGPQFYKYWAGSGALYLLERLYREYRGRCMTRITKVVQHPSEVVEIQFKKEGFVGIAGQYVFLNCPELGIFEWHPFTLTSAPEEDFASVHIRVVGDWTRALAYRLGCRFGHPDEHLLPKNYVLPYIMIDGGYGSASEDVFNFETSILVGAGIGVTPFASILKTIWYRKRNGNLRSLRKVYFIWICRDKNAFEWFQDLLYTLEEENIGSFIEFHSYLTGNLAQNEVKNIFINDRVDGVDAITGLQASTNFGRPNFDNILFKIRDNHPQQEICVFFCGPVELGKRVEGVCSRLSQKNGTKFFYNKENF